MRISRGFFFFKDLSALDKLICFNLYLKLLKILTGPDISLRKQKFNKNFHQRNSYLYLYFEW